MRTLVCLIALALLAPVASAQTTSSVSTGKATWEIHVNVQRLFASPLGDLVNRIIEKEAPGGEAKIATFVEALGLDPRTDVGEVVIFGNDFTHTSATAVVDLGSKRGNIEGWLLAAPGYQSEQLSNGLTLHSIDVDDEDVPRFWCALPKKPNGNFVLVAGFDANKVRLLVGDLSQAKSQGITDNLADSTFLALDVNDLTKAPIEIDDDEPGSAIIKTLQSISFAAAAEPSQLATSCEVTTDTPERAQQLQQLITGMKAMLQLAMPQKDPDLEQFAKWLNNLTVEHVEGESLLSARFVIDYSAIEELVELKHKTEY